MASQPTTVVLQPTTLCNLDCVYCYLPSRHVARRMSEAVANAVAETVATWGKTDTVELVWHGGEPLAAGLSHLDLLMGIFDGLNVVHNVQTNATLVNDAWCDLFERRDVQIGVSIDGPAWLDGLRVDRAGRAAHQRIVDGITLLRERGLEFGVIAVVSDPTPATAAELYLFCLEIGSSWLGINIEEREGVNTRSNTHERDQVTGFWTELGRCWADHPDDIRVREIDDMLDTAPDRLDDPMSIDSFPTVAWDGAVTLISPELAGFTSERLGEFACGNVLQTPLSELVTVGMSAAWVQEFQAGLAACQVSCPYFASCGGAHAANRYFEHGRFDITETNHCVNTQMTLADGLAVLDLQPSRAAKFDNRRTWDNWSKRDAWKKKKVYFRNR